MRRLGISARMAPVRLPIESAARKNDPRKPPCSVHRKSPFEVRDNACEVQRRDNQIPAPKTTTATAKRANGQPYLLHVGRSAVTVWAGRF